MTNQSLDGQLEKKEVEIPLPLKECIRKIGAFFFDDKKSRGFFGVDLSAKRSTKTKSFSLR